MNLQPLTIDFAPCADAPARVAGLALYARPAALLAIAALALFAWTLRE